MLLIKQATIYSPEYKGKKDVLISENKIIKIEDSIHITGIEIDIIDANEFVMIPGLIDQHVHVTGGGGEGGFKTRVPEVMLSDLINGGVTTVVGLLGTDSATRSIEQLVAKTHALNEEGVTAYALTGSYKYPSPTITDCIEKDIVFVDPIIGLKIALSDHRSSMIQTETLASIASEARRAGMIAGKSGHVVCHMGDGKEGLKPVMDIVQNYDLPITTLRPTHVNRNPELLKQSLAFLQLGGMIDLTCGIKKDLSASDVLTKWLSLKLDMHTVTVSSDGFGSWSSYDTQGKLIKMGVSSVDAMFHELKDLVMEKRVPLNTALPFFTSNVATALNLQNSKGCVEVGYDADLLLINRSFSIDTVIAKGQVMMKDKQVLVFGTYEK